MKNHMIKNPTVNKMSVQEKTRMYSDIVLHDYLTSISIPCNECPFGKTNPHAKKEPLTFSTCYTKHKGKCPKTLADLIKVYSVAYGKEVVGNLESNGEFQLESNGSICIEDILELCKKDVYYIANVRNITSLIMRQLPDLNVIEFGSDNYCTATDFSTPFLLNEIMLLL